MAPSRTARMGELKTEFKAYEAEKKARSPVKNTVVPMAKYLLMSVGHRSKIDFCAPDEKSRNDWISLIAFRLIL